MAYGRNRLWPSYAARPYNRFTDHKQFQYILLCLGQGHFNVEEIRVEDTPLANYPEIESQILQPGETLTLFNDNVVTSVEVGGLELLAPDQDDYPVDGWVGPFTVNGSGTETELIEVDLVCPAGLYFNNSGVFSNVDVLFTFEARKIDDSGAPIGGWFNLENGTIEDNTSSVRQYTRSYTVAAGRYEVRGRRTNNASGSSQIVTKTVWQTARAFLPAIGVYEGVTCLALKIRGTNSFNDGSRQRFNVIATRKLPVWDDENSEWLDAPEDLAPTRSVVMAFCDAFRAQYGGKLADSYLDMVELMAMDTKLEEAGIFFDWVFDSKITLLEAASTICRVGRCIPMMAGSRLFMIRDEPQETPVLLVSPDNMLEGSFSMEVKLFEFDAYDSTIVEYVDPSTFEAVEVVCVLPGGTQNNPERMKLPGCTSKTTAWREGMYQNYVRRYLRKRITFRTGLEGIIPVYGDIIRLSHDVPRWGQSGLVLDYQIGESSTLLSINEPLTFEEGTDYRMMLRDRFGAPQGPFVAVAGPEENQVLIETVLDPIEFPLSDSREALMFTFGPVDLHSQLCKLVSIRPEGADESVTIECIPYNPVVYTADSLLPP